MNDHTNPAPHSPNDAGVRRLFLHEPGWQVRIKQGSNREFCFMMAPGQDYYHRLLDGEIVLQRGDERLCLACADRRGLLSHEPKKLRELLGSLEFDVDASGSEFEIKPVDEIDWPA